MKTLKKHLRLSRFFGAIFFAVIFAASANCESVSNSKKQNESWLSPSVPSIKETYKDIFDSFGIACGYGIFGDGWGTPGQLYYEKVQNGLAKHANSITAENELKPQVIFSWWDAGKKKPTQKFVASNGAEIDVPKTIEGFSRLNKILKICKDKNLKMRGHVLTWHSQTPDDFFAENYIAKYQDSTKNLLANPVSKEVMTARHEWYIKSVLEYVANWEKQNGYAGSGEGNHIIWAWDVLNEAVADDAGKTFSGNSQNWLRGSTAQTKNKKPEDGGSRWFQIYGDDEFIINAFRFANAYAPKDAVLCYNDYNTYMNNKPDAILNLLNNVKNGETKTIGGKEVAPRIDVMGMQSHCGVTFPNINDYEKTLKRFLNAGFDVHVTELDFSATTQNDSTRVYSEYFKILKKYGKNYDGDKKIKNVTIWGINNENSWIYKNGTKYPLLFAKSKSDSNDFTITPSFTAVINAATAK